MKSKEMLFPSMAGRRRKNPYAARRRARRAPIRRRMAMRGRLNPRLSLSRLYHYKQAVNGASITGFGGSRTLVQSASFSTNGIICRLGDLPQASTFAGLYDEYRINYIVLKFVPMVNMLGVIQSAPGTTAALDGTVTNPGCLHTVLDPDGSPPNTLLTMEQYRSYKMTPCITGRTVVLKCRPGILTGVQGSSGSIEVGGVKKRQWIDCQETDVNHYVGAWALDPYAAATAAQTYNILAYYYVSFRNVR